MVQATEAPPQGEPNHAPHEAVDLAQRTGRDAAAAGTETRVIGRTVSAVGQGGVALVMWNRRLNGRGSRAPR